MQDNNRLFYIILLFVISFQRWVFTNRSVKYTTTVTKRSTLRPPYAAEFLLLYALETTVNSKVHSRANPEM